MSKIFSFQLRGNRGRKVFSTQFFSNSPKSGKHQQTRFLAAAIRVARFFLVKCTKTGKIYLIATNLNKRQFNMYVHQMAVKYTQMTLKSTKILQNRRSKRYPNEDFWYENMKVCHLATPAALSMTDEREGVARLTCKVKKKDDL
jgi:hypothetical protein